MGSTAASLPRGRRGRGGGASVGAGASSRAVVAVGAVRRVYTVGEAGHSQGGGPPWTALGAGEDVRAV
jgi:hypothetical protein